MAAEQVWTGSEAEVVGTTPPPSGDEASAWDVVTDRENPTVKEEEIIDKLADDLSQVVKIDDEPDFSPDDPSKDQHPNNSSEPKEPDVSTTSATEPPPSTDQPAAATDTPPPPSTDQPAAATDTPIPPAADASNPKKVTLGLSSLQVLEPLEATEGEGPKPTLVARPSFLKGCSYLKGVETPEGFPRGSTTHLWG